MFDNFNINPYYKIIGIDPGTESMGISIFQIDLNTLDIVDIKSKTYFSSKLPRYINTELIHGERIQKLSNIKYNLINILNIEKPNLVTCESPFINMKRPGAFAALNEVVSTIRNTIIEYDVQLNFILVEPSNVKKAVGAPGNCDKETIKKICKNNIIFNNLINIDMLDEHSIDSMCVAYHGYNILKERINYGFY